MGDIQITWSTTCERHHQSQFFRCPTNRIGDLCQYENPCTPNQCQNGGKCSYTIVEGRGAEFKCSCPIGELVKGGRTAGWGDLLDGIVASDWQLIDCGKTTRRESQGGAGGAGNDAAAADRPIRTAAVINDGRPRM